MVILETLQIAFLCAYLYRVTVTYNGNVAIAEKAHWTLETTALFGGLIGGLVQSFFAYRIFVLSKRWPIPMISWTGSFLAFTGTLAIPIVATVTDMTRYLAEFGWLVTTVSVLLLSVDIINTVALCTYLRVGKTGYQSTDCMLNKLFIWTLETGLLTSIGALIMLVTSLALPNTALWVGVSGFYCKLYSNSLMASLNAREILRNMTTEDDRIANME
ncbi:hypothetical protein HWV62_33039 [Athelia sp. TMB]|nr:hypothetical protein HWV62_33039 [Athelia sp. TMB]